MTLAEWAARWGLSQQCIAEFLALPLTAPSDSTSGHSESNVQSRVRLEAAQKGVYLFRNNVGAGQLENGSFVRWGLGNDSTRLNEVIKSADLIGLRRRLIVPADVGSYIGQFVSREIKETGWVYTGRDREEAQLRWATLVNSQGGDAKIVSDTGSL